MKKHFSKFGIALAAALLMLLSCALCASAAGTATVVYLSGSGDSANDGLTADTPVASINAAYGLLDPEEDCTVVVCGEFTQNGNFAKGHSAKSVTITSMYGGVDYRKSGAVYKVSGNRFGLADDTTFENITFESTGGAFLLVAQHHAVTVGEGVLMNNFDGTKESKAFWVVGSVQWKFGGAISNGNAFYKDRPTPVNVTVLSGSDMIVVGGPREFSTANGVKASNACTYGDINIHIGGNAEVNTLYAAGYKSAYTAVGNVTVEVSGEAAVGNINGAYYHNVTASDFKLLWTSGNVGSFVMKPNGKVGLTSTGDTMLETTEDVQGIDGYETIAANFKTKSTHTHDLDIDNGKVLVPATCSAEGKVQYACKICSATIEQSLPKRDDNHTYGDWTITQEPTADAPGEKKHTCTGCDAAETRKLYLSEPGDLNGDGKASKADLLLLQKKLAGWQVDLGDKAE